LTAVFEVGNNPKLFNLKMNLEIIVLIIIFTFFANIVSLLGGLILLWRKVWEGENIVHLLAFAAGVLLATAFLDLLPEAQKSANADPKFLSLV